MTVELALIDMDGTIYSGDSPIKGVNKALRFLRRKDIEVMFLTNYAGRKRGDYQEKLERMNFDVEEDEIVTSAWLTAKYLSQNLPKSSIFVLGEQGLKEELQDEGLNVVETPRDTDVVVVSNKHDLHYEDLANVLQGASSQVSLIGTNPDETIPGEDGLIPGAGTVISAVETMIGKEADIVGKPSQNAVETVLNIKDISPEDCIMIGDRLNTDIVMANRNGMKSFLVLSGVTEEEDLKKSEISPDVVIDSIADLPSQFSE